MSRRPSQVQGLVLAVVAVYWALAIGVTLAGQSDLISHDAIIEEGHLPPLLAVTAFLVVWQLMTGAMMLPSTLPAIGVYARLVRGRPQARAAVALFVGTYFAVWTGFALLALAGDTRIHWAVDSWAWLAQRQWLIGGSLLIGAGLFQLTPLKERCLTGCRNPLQFVWQRYEPGLRGAVRVGLAHAIYCLGCCWALMLVMFGLGVGSVTIMAALGGVMLLEKTWSLGARLVPYVSAGLISLGLLVMAAPAWVASLPALP